MSYLVKPEYSMRLRAGGLCFKEMNLDLVSRLQIVKKRLANNNPDISFMRYRKWDTDEQPKMGRTYNPPVTIERIYGGLKVPIDSADLKAQTDNNNHLDFEISGITLPPAHYTESADHLLMRIIRTKLVGQLAHLPYKNNNPESLIVNAVIGGEPKEDIKTPDNVYRNEEMILMYENFRILPWSEYFTEFDGEKVNNLFLEGGFVSSIEEIGTNSTERYVLMCRLNIGLLALSPKEQEILTARFGLSEVQLSFDEIGQKYATSGKRIEQLHARALRFLRYLNKTHERNLGLR